MHSIQGFIIKYRLSCFPSRHPNQPDQAGAEEVKNGDPEAALFFMNLYYWQEGIGLLRVLFQ